MNYLDERSGRLLVLEGHHNPCSKHDQNIATASPKFKTNHNLFFFSKMPSALVDDQNVSNEFQRQWKPIVY